jgi:hypothetical protein
MEVWIVTRFPDRAAPVGTIVMFEGISASLSIDRAKDNASDA